MYWFTADEHYGHKNVLAYCKRPFSSIHNMDIALIQNHNNVVSTDDTTFHLGDFTNIGVYRQLVNKYGEERVIAVLGNMDGRNLELSSLLPEFRDLTLLGHHILLLHGWGAPIKIIERISKRYDTSEYDLIVFGHTHRHLLIQKGQKWYFNPGPCKARGSFGFIELTPDEIIPRIVQI